MFLLRITSYDFREASFCDFCVSILSTGEFFKEAAASFGRDDIFPFILSITIWDKTYASTATRMRFMTQIFYFNNDIII